MKQIFNNSIEEFGFVGSHVFTNDLASVLQSTALKELMGWPSLYLLAFYSLENQHFFSKPIVKQALQKQHWTGNHITGFSCLSRIRFSIIPQKANRSDIGKK